MKNDWALAWSWYCSECVCIRTHRDTHLAAWEDCAPIPFVPAKFLYLCEIAAVRFIYYETRRKLSRDNPTTNNLAHEKWALLSEFQILTHPVQLFTFRSIILCPPNHFLFPSYVTFYHIIFINKWDHEWVISFDIAITNHPGEIINPEIENNEDLPLSRHKSRLNEKCHKLWRYNVNQRYTISFDGARLVLWLISLMSLLVVQGIGI